MKEQYILIFSSRLLSPSETFIKSQAEGLTHFVPHYTGSRRVKNGLLLPADRASTVNCGGIIGKTGEALFKATGIAPRFYLRLKRLNPMLLHAHSGVNGALSLPIARSLDIPLVVTFHGRDAGRKPSEAETYSQRLYFRRRDLLWREATQIIAVSAYIKEKLLAAGLPDEKVLVHYIGVNTEVFSPDQSKEKRPVVLFVGRLVEKKGVQHLIYAMASVQESMPEVELVIIGDGPLRDSLYRLAQSKLRKFQFLGVQPSESIKSWMDTASVLAAPSVTSSRGDTEGLPIVILEAQAMGLPVVSTFHAGIPEAIIDGENGLLTEESDVPNLASALTTLLKSPELRATMGSNGRNRMLSHFNLRKQSASLEDIYRQAIESYTFRGTGIRKEKDLSKDTVKAHS